MYGLPLKRSGQRGLGGEFNKLWAASAASNLGDGVTLVAAPLLAAALTRDPVMVAGLAFAHRVPWLLFPLISGALADRLDRRQAMAAVAIWRASLIGLLGLAVHLDMANIPLLYIVFFLLSTGETLFDISAATMVPALVPAHQLPAANARIQGTMTVTNQFIGPPLGGALFAMVVAVPFLFGAGWVAAAGALVLMLRGSSNARQRRGRYLGTFISEVRDGIAWLWRHELLRTLAITLAILNLTVVAQVSIMVLFAQERLGLGPAGFGLILTAHGTGAIIGSMVAARVIRALRTGTVLKAALLIECAIPLGIALSTSPVAVGALLAIFGLHTMVWGALLVSLRQELTPDHLRGRVESVYRLLEHGAAAPGAIAGGILASWLGLTAPFWVGAVIALVLIPFVWGKVSQESVDLAREIACAD